MLRSTSKRTTRCDVFLSSQYDLPSGAPKYVQVVFWYYSTLFLVHVNVDNVRSIVRFSFIVHYPYTVSHSHRLRCRETSISKNIYIYKIQNKVEENWSAQIPKRYPLRDPARDHLTSFGIRSPANGLALSRPARLSHLSKVTPGVADAGAQNRGRRRVTMNYNGSSMLRTVY